MTYGAEFSGEYTRSNPYIWTTPKGFRMTRMLIKYFFVALLITASSCSSRVTVCKRPILPDIELSINGDPFVAKGIGRIHPDDSLLQRAYLATLDTPTFLSFINILGNYIKIPSDRKKGTPVSILLYTNNSIHQFNTDSLIGILIITVDTVKGKMHSLLFRHEAGKGFTELKAFNNSGYYFKFDELVSISPKIFDEANWAFFSLDQKQATKSPKKSMFLRRSLFYKPLRKYGK